MPGLPGGLDFAIRQMRRNPAFTAAAVACLALGIGATSAIFSVVSAVVLRPLPYKASSGLLRVYSEWPTWPGGGMYRFWISPPEFEAIRRDNRVFETLDAWQSGGVNLSTSGAGEPVRVNIAQVSGTLLSTLGVPPLHGRLLDPAGDVEGAPGTVVLSYGLWQGAFGGDPGVLHREVLIDGVKASVIGIMPRGFEFPPGEAEPVELWAPLQLTAADRERWGNHRLSLLARLRPGHTAAQASQELDRLEHAYGGIQGANGHRPNPRTHTLASFPLLDETVGSVRPAMMMMAGATLLVLLIACANVANLLLARAQNRQREVALRQALGASAFSLFRQFLLEGALLSMLGAAFGLLLAWGFLRLILRSGAASIPRASEVRMDETVLLFALAAAAVTGTIFALAPLVQAIRPRSSEALKSGGSRTTATREAHWLRHSLVVSGIAVAAILLAGAGLLVQTFWRLTRVDPGVHTEGVLTTRVALPRKTYPRPADTRRFWRETLDRVRAIPSVEAAAVIAALPPQRPINANDTYIEGLVATPGGPGHNVDYWNGVSAGAFELLGVPLEEGRYLDSRDVEGAPGALVVNRTFARRFYGNQSAIGRRVKPGGQPKDDTPWFTIVGVVSDLKNQGLDRPAGTELFFSLEQARAAGTGTLLVKGRGAAAADPWTLLPPVRDRIRQIDAALPLSQVRPLEDAIAQSRARPRFLALLLGLFALVALGLAIGGIFSVMTYTVAQRTNEFGIRMALGARAGQVLSLVLRQGMTLVTAGILFGAAGSWAAARALRGTVADLAEWNWLPLAATAALLVLAAAAACWIPARRATQVHPVTALRTD